MLRHHYVDVSLLGWFQLKSFSLYESFWTFKSGCSSFMKRDSLIFLAKLDLYSFPIILNDFVLTFLCFAFYILCCTVCAYVYYLYCLSYSLSATILLPGRIHDHRYRVISYIIGLLYSWTGVIYKECNNIFVTFWRDNFI